MSALQVFTFEGSEVRTVIRDSEPWWVAADVAAVLGLSNLHSSLAHLDEDERTLHSVESGQRSMSIINESGLYSMILRSRKPEAKSFKRWVTREVLPSIRKTGRFDMTPAAPAPAQLEITAAAGPLPYRDQAEILAILRPALPEPYATATAKMILARAMGERPELEPSETPLYAATFLAEKGHRAKTVAKFQSGFGSRVSNAYFKRYGRRPEKIAGPAGSRIDKVAMYTDGDRPLLEEVYAGMADLISAFEHGGQTALSA